MDSDSDSYILWDYPGPPIDPSDLALRPLYFDSSPVINSLPPCIDKQDATGKDDLKPPKMFSTTNRILNTVELLEQILKNCLFIDLLTCLPPSY